MWNLISLWRQRIATARKVQAAVNDTQFTTLQPKQAMPVSVRKSGCFQPKTSFQHSDCPAKSSTGRAKQQQPETERPMPPDAAGKQLHERLRVRYTQLPRQYGVRSDDKTALAHIVHR